MIEHYPQGDGHREERKAETRVLRRADDRLVGIGVAIPVPPIARGRKDRRRWCRGRIGVPHQVACQPLRTWCGVSLPGWQEDVCTVCGKSLKLLGPNLGGAE